jgi:hypothetical protein
LFTLSNQSQLWKPKQVTELYKYLAIPSIPKPESLKVLEPNKKSGQNAEIKNVHKKSTLDL